MQRLTWHDPLADQFLSRASLLEFELEDCMETEEVWGETRGEQIVSGNYRLLPSTVHHPVLNSHVVILQSKRTHLISFEAAK